MTSAEQPHARLRPSCRPGKAWTQKSARMAVPRYACTPRRPGSSANSSGSMACRLSRPRPQSPVVTWGLRARHTART